MWFFKKRSQKNEPVTVNAPIVTDARRKEGAKPLLDFIKNLEAHSNIEIAAAEGERLLPYFNAMSGVITKALETSPRNETDTQVLLVNASPSGLRRMFNYIAERTRNTLTSDVSIVPMTVTQQGPASHYFKDQPQFSVPYEIGGFKFSFGFLQVYEGGKVRNARSSTSFPVFMIDERMTDAIKDFQPENLLKGLQSTLTFINHDVLHHFTLPVITGAVAKKFDEKGNGMDAQGYTLQKWLAELPAQWKDHPLYEDWAQMAHEVTMRQPANAPALENFKQGVDAYFDELKRIGAEIAEKTGSRHDAHMVVDFYGTLMAHTLCRVFEIDHPVMTQALVRMHDADPMPSSPEGVAADMLGLNVPGLSAKSALQQIRQVAQINKQYKDVVDHYRQRGIDMMPDDDKDLTWRGMKLHQLMRVSFDDVHPHMGKPVTEAMQKLRGTIDAEMLNMMSAATNTFRFHAGR